jgi:SAM-dependent methyltransferase
MTNQADALEIANAAQLETWNGHEGRHWAENADRYERANRRFAERLIEAADVSASDAVLDIGCGTGRTTRDVARLAPRGSALGVDLSAAMLDYAREQSRADGLTNVAFVQADVQTNAFDENAFDVAISSFGAMFFDDPISAFTNIGRALRPGGRAALVVWRELARNEWLTELRAAVAVGRQLPEPPPGAPSLFGLADPDRTRELLVASGFESVDLDPIDEPVELGAPAEDAYAFVRTLGIIEGLTRDLDDTTRARALEQLRTAVSSHATTDGVLFGGSAWLITARRP